MRLVVTQPIPDAKVKEAERGIEQRSHWQAQISVASVASQSELALMMQRIQNAAAAQPPAPPPPPKPLADINAEVIARVQPVLDKVWPAVAPLQKFAVSLQPDGLGLTVWYTGKSSLPTIAVGILQTELAENLSVPTLALNAIRVKQPATHRTTRHTPHR